MSQEERDLIAAWTRAYLMEPWGSEFASLLGTGTAIIARGKAWKGVGPSGSGVNTHGGGGGVQVWTTLAVFPNTEAGRVLAGKWMGGRGQWAPEVHFEVVKPVMTRVTLS